MDVTYLLMKNIISDIFDEDQEIDVDVSEGLILSGTIKINDNRIFSNHVNDCDGLCDLISGILEIEYDLSVINENGDEIDFDFDEGELEDFIN